MSFPAVLAGIWAIVLAAAPTDQAASQPSLQCDIGPVTHTYGKTPWVIYSCVDKQTVVLITPGDSPAATFIFTFYVRDGKYELYGEGPGSKVFTDPAYEDLKKLSAADIAALIKETQSVSSLAAH